MGPINAHPRGKLCLSQLRGDPNELPATYDFLLTAAPEFGRLGLARSKIEEPMSISEIEHYRRETCREALGLLVNLLLGVARGNDNSRGITSHLQKLNDLLISSERSAPATMDDVVTFAHDTLLSKFNPETSDRDSSELLLYALRLSAYHLSDEPRHRTRVASEREKLVRAMRQSLKEHDGK